MRKRGAIGVLVALLALTSLFAFGSHVGGSPEGFLSVQGKWIVDSLGQAVLLRGVNYPGLAELVPLTHSEANYATFASYGFNVVRLEMAWANLEPTQNTFRLSYLTSYVDQDIAWAKKHGLYVVLEMGQYKWAKKFGGGSAPDWTVAQYATNERGMKAAISNFWVNSTLQVSLAAVWRNVAQHYADEPAIAGYDIFNEPWAFAEETPANQASQVTVFYNRVIAQIREVDSNHILFLEPAVQNTYSSPVSDRNIVWSPHFYALSFADTYSHDSVNVLEADLVSKYNQFVLAMGRPMWIGEFGAFMKDNSYLTWLQDAKNLFDKYQLGWGWFAFYPADDSSIPQPLRTPITLVLLYTVTVTSFSATAPQLPPIPGFAWESILAGLILGLTTLALKRRRAKHRTGRSLPNF